MRAQQRAGVAASLYDLRHTFASRLLAAGEARQAALDELATLIADTDPERELCAT